MSSSSIYPYCGFESVICCTPNESPSELCTLSMLCCTLPAGTVLCTLPAGVLFTLPAGGVLLWTSELDATVFLTGTQVEEVHCGGLDPQDAAEDGVPPHPELVAGVEPHGEGGGGVPAMELELRRPPDEILVRRGPAAEGAEGPTAAVEKGDEAEGGDEPNSQPCLLGGEVLILPDGDPLLVRRTRPPHGEVLNLRSRDRPENPSEE